ncbi:helix-turn-helix domain-containing protein [Streptomyces sp. NBC_01207]|uniref:helix-turn-helix domain-containing protein n=1 Tax=Streptomyces sp. NBC_01207 TaxID=2903772 RepID=UPI002E0DCF15|nr:helix-turn-helix domain-containing protein [Streptomyces sp. NBC_01207]
MALENPSAPSHPSSAVPSAIPRSDVIHVNVRHASHYTVVGNHLLQHRGLSATAIGIGAHVQSLPEGTPVGVKALTERFPEGEIRIGSALRELERHGYLERRRERLATGRVVTRTYSYNKPAATAAEPPPPPVWEPEPEPVREPEPAPEPEPEPVLVPEPEPEPAPEPEAVVPPPVRPVHPEAAGLLAGLRRYDPRLLLSERDVRQLAPDVSIWLERGITPEVVARALSADLPEPMRRPASVLAYRLAAMLPPPLPPLPVARRAGTTDGRTRCRTAVAATAPSAPPPRPLPELPAGGGRGGGVIGSGHAGFFSRRPQTAYVSRSTVVVRSRRRGSSRWSGRWGRRRSR